jgi:hypothetical protein
MNIIKEIQSLKCKIANLFNNLTETQAKQISNAMNNIMDTPLYYYAYNTENNVFKFLIDETPLNISNTLGNQRMFYPIQEAPYTVKVAEDSTPTLSFGKYIFIDGNFDGVQYQKLSKTLVKDTVLGTYSNSANMSVRIENIGQELIVAQPFNIEIENNTSKNSIINAISQYYSKDFQLTDNIIVQTEQYTLWDYIQLQVKGFNMIGESQSIRLTVWDNAMTQQYGSQTFNVGTDYSGGNYGFGYIYPNGGNRNFKLIVEYI